MTVRRLVGTGVLVTGLLTATNGTSLYAQHPVEAMEWMMNVLRPSGRPVVPIFEGWYQKPDGMYDLCFGYFSLNTRVGLISSIAAGRTAMSTSPSARKEHHQICQRSVRSIWTLHWPQPVV